ncbi:hypothetical protein K8R78_02805 [bacterium]|nr:hypothetical protein [bacterium]
MKTTLLLLLTVLLLSASAVCLGPFDNLFGLNDDPITTIGMRLGYHSPFREYGEGFNGALTGGLRIGWWMEPFLDLSLNFEYAAPAWKEVADAAEQESSILSSYLQVKFLLTSPFSPYLVGGPGLYYHYQNDGTEVSQLRFGLNVGGGVEFGFVGIIGVFMEGVLHWLPEDPDMDALHYVNVQAGIYGFIW